MSGAPATCHVPMDANARILWEKIYRETPSMPGTLGAILERFTAQVQKVALDYALMDCSKVITRDASFGRFSGREPLTRLRQINLLGIHSE